MIDKEKKEEDKKKILDILKARLSVSNEFAQQTIGNKTEIKQK